jgi:hypothetical protein
VFRGFPAEQNAHVYFLHYRKILQCFRNFASGFAPI